MPCNRRFVSFILFFLHNKVNKLKLLSRFHMVLPPLKKDSLFKPYPGWHYVSVQILLTFDPQRDKSRTDIVFFGQNRQQWISSFVIKRRKCIWGKNTTDKSSSKFFGPKFLFSAQKILLLPRVACVGFYFLNTELQGEEISHFQWYTDCNQFQGFFFAVFAFAECFAQRENQLQSERRRSSSWFFFFFFFFFLQIQTHTLGHTVWFFFTFFFCTREPLPLPPSGKGKWNMMCVNWTDTPSTHTRSGPLWSSALFYTYTKHF